MYFFENILFFERVSLSERLEAALFIPPGRKTLKIEEEEAAAVLLSPFASSHRRHFVPQKKKEKADTYYCLADFIAPKETEKPDYIGGFATTAGFEVEEYAKTFEATGDDYSAIMVKALGDRFAEALTEKLHKEVRDQRIEFCKNIRAYNHAIADYAISVFPNASNPETVAEMLVDTDLTLPSGAILDRNVRQASGIEQNLK